MVRGDRTLATKSGDFGMVENRLGFTQSTDQRQDREVPVQRRW